MQDANAEFYDRLWGEQTRRPSRHQHLKNRIFAVSQYARRVVRQPASILDLGCGLGYVGSALTDLGRVFAADLSTAAVVGGCRLHPALRFCRGDALSRFFRRASFDLVVASEIIEHLAIGDRTRFLEVVHDLLKPGGHLILTTPNRALSRYVDRDQPIENHLSESELIDVLSDSYRVIENGSTQRFLPILCHRYRAFQALRLFSHEILRLRPYLENPSRVGPPGLYMVVLAQRRDSRRRPSRVSTQPGQG